MCFGFVKYMLTLLCAEIAAHGASSFDYEVVETSAIEIAVDCGTDGDLLLPLHCSHHHLHSYYLLLDDYYLHLHPADVHLHYPYSYSGSLELLLTI